MLEATLTRAARKDNYATFNSTVFSASLCADQESWQPCELPLPAAGSVRSDDLAPVLLRQELLLLNQLQYQSDQLMVASPGMRLYR